MPSVGPQLPPYLAEKRKRGSDASHDDTPSSPDSASKRPRVAGPTLPPGPLDERPPEPAEADNDTDESSDDDFGPALPTAQDAQKPTAAIESASAGTVAPSVKRDDWMTMAPSSGDWSSRMDPTQLKARKFNSGKGSSQPKGVADASWHETPEQKQKRLQQEMMGIKDKELGSAAPLAKTKRDEDAEATAKRLEEYNKERGPSLYEAHKTKKGRDEDDDPSARAFDREKDIAGGLQINATKRRDMVKRAEGLGSRFSTAKYL